MFKKNQRVAAQATTWVCLVLWAGAIFLPVQTKGLTRQEADEIRRAREFQSNIYERLRKEGPLGIGNICGYSMPGGLNLIPGNDEICKSGDCEVSDIISGKTELMKRRVWFCDCNDNIPSADCLQAYGPPPGGGDWKCFNGGATQHGVDFCQSTKGGYTFYAASPRPPNLGQRCLHNSAVCINDDCTKTGGPCSSNDCETSSLVDKTTRQPLYFCDCFADSDCYTAYGAPPSGGEWNCVDGANATYDLDYCMSTKGDLRYAVTPGDPSLLDALLDPTAAAAIGLSKVSDDINEQMAIKIPGLDLSKLKRTDESGNLYIPWIGEYIAAIYRYAMLAGSILAVIMIIIQGARVIVSAGGEQKMAGYKRIGQIVAGLFILWGSYAILYNINPALTVFKPISTKYVGEIALDGSDRGDVSLYQRPPQEGLNFTGFDALFQSYGNCLSVDWHVLKALAYAESTFVVGAESGRGYSGLFQTNEKTCMAVLTNYTLANRCDNVNDPETSAMVGTAIMKDAAEKIRKKCPNVSSDSLIYFIYLGHHAPAALDYTLEKTCEYQQARSHIHDFWQKYKGGKYADNSGEQRNASVLADGTDRTAKKMISLIKNSMGIANPEAVSGDDKTCPLTNKDLIDKTSITLPGTIPCDNPSNAGLVKIESGAGLNIKTRNPYLTPQAADALIRAGELAKNDGYNLIVTAACRDMETQEELAAKQKNRKAVAPPGKSAHGYGIAVDVALGNSEGKSLLKNMGETSKQCNENSKYVETLSRIMYQAGFSRYAAENWHFELPAYSNNCRSNSFIGLSPCGADCPLSND